jgi:hypothetical protein
MERDLTMSGSTYFSGVEVQQMRLEMTQEIDALMRAVNRIDEEDEILPKTGHLLLLQSR